jgi:hypothetical protein
MPELKFVMDPDRGDCPQLFRPDGDGHLTQLGSSYVIDAYGELWLWEPATTWDAIKKFFGFGYTSVPFRAPTFGQTKPRGIDPEL